MLSPLIQGLIPTSGTEQPIVIPTLLLVAPGRRWRVLREEGFLWVSPQPMSQQTVSERLREFPAALFRRVLLDVLPELHQRWQGRRADAGARPALGPGPL